MDAGEAVSVVREVVEVVSSRMVAPLAFVPSVELAVVSATPVKVATDREIAMLDEAV